MSNFDYFDFLFVYLFSVNQDFKETIEMTEIPEDILFEDIISNWYSVAKEEYQHVYGGIGEHDFINLFFQECKNQIIQEIYASYN